MVNQHMENSICFCRYFLKASLTLTADFQTLTKSHYLLTVSCARQLLNSQGYSDEHFVDLLLNLILLM